MVEHLVFSITGGLTPASETDYGWTNILREPEPETYRVSVNITASLEKFPRAITSHSPSRDQS